MHGLARAVCFICDEIDFEASFVVVEDICQNDLGLGRSSNRINIVLLVNKYAH